MHNHAPNRAACGATRSAVVAIKGFNSSLNRNHFGGGQREDFLLGVLLLHLAGNRQPGVGADRLDLLSAVDNHQVAVDDAVAASVRGRTAGAIRLDRMGSGEGHGKNRTAVIRSGGAGEFAVAIKDEVEGRGEGTKVGIVPSLELLELLMGPVDVATLSWTTAKAAGPILDGQTLTTNAG